MFAFDQLPSDMQGEVIARIDDNSLNAAVRTCRFFREALTDRIRNYRSELDKDVYQLFLNRANIASPQQSIDNFSENFDKFLQKYPNNPVACRALLVRIKIFDIPANLDMHQIRFTLFTTILIAIKLKDSVYLTSVRNSFKDSIDFTAIENIFPNKLTDKDRVFLALLFPELQFHIYNLLKDYKLKDQLLQQCTVECLNKLFEKRLGNDESSWTWLIPYYKQRNLIPSEDIFYHQCTNERKLELLKQLVWTFAPSEKFVTHLLRRYLINYGTCTIPHYRTMKNISQPTIYFLMKYNPDLSQLVSINNLHFPLYGKLRHWHDTIHSKNALVKKVRQILYKPS